jgi:hypothetical protein
MMANPCQMTSLPIPCSNWNNDLGLCRPRHRRFAASRRHEGESFRDDLVRVFVDVADEPDHRLFFIEFKERMKARFQQIDIWLTTYPIEVL